MADRRSDDATARFGKARGNIRRSLALITAMGILLAVGSACAPGGQSKQQAVIDNAVDADTQSVDDANDRADHLDEASDELLAAANRTGGVQGQALRNESQSDLAAAAAARAEGSEAGAEAEDDIEQKAGLLNTH